MDIPCLTSEWRRTVTIDSRPTLQQHDLNRGFRYSAELEPLSGPTVAKMLSAH